MSSSKNEDDLIWSFGYGSNMDMQAMVDRKKVNVLDSCPAVLRNYRMAFSLKAMPLVEPSFANIEEKEGEEVHGVAFCMTLESADKLNKMEMGYNTQMVPLEAYDGRELRGYIFIVKNKTNGECPPSKRYLNILCKGAKQAGLKQSYIDKLSQTPTYKPADWVLKMRTSRPDPHALPEITVDQLAQHVTAPDDLWVSCLGYVLKRNRSMESHRGRDITARSVINFHGLSMRDNDDSGKPPFPLVKDLKPDELEFVTCWLDCLQAADSTDGSDNILEFIGYLKEFKEQQDSGETTFVFPKLPK